MKVSVVIPCYNVGPRLGRLLSSLAWAPLDPGDSLEIVVVDDGSTDTTSDIVASFSSGHDLVYVFLPRTAASGRAAARNAGIQKAGGDLIVLLDGDQICAPGLVAEHVRYHRLRPDLVVIGPRHDLADTTFDDTTFDDTAFGIAGLAGPTPKLACPDGREGVLAEFSGNLNNLESCWHFMFSCNVSVPREYLLAAGGFDERFTGWGMEDCELGYRLRRAGLAFAYNPAAVAYQRCRDVTCGMVAEWRRNLAYFMDKYRDAPDVAAQLIACRVYDPADRGIDWIEGMRRLELAACALAGRIPGPTAFHWVETDDGNVAEVAAWLPEHAPIQNLVVIDDTEQASLAGPVQCLDTPRELLYYHRPPPAIRDSLHRRYPRSRTR